MRALGATAQLLASSPALVTQAPVLRERQQQQQQSEVCAYISGSANSPIACGIGSTCSVGSYGNVQCCSLTCDNNYIGCMGYPSTAFANIYLECPSATPACVYIAILAVTSGYTVTNYQYTCGPSSTTIVALKTVRSVAAAVPGSVSTSSPAPLSTATPARTSSTLAAASSSSPTSSAQVNSVGALVVTSTSTAVAQAFSTTTTTSSASPTAASSSLGSDKTPIAATVVPAVVVPILGYILLIVFATRTQKRSLLRLLTCGLSGRSTSDENDEGGGYHQRITGDNNATINGGGSNNMAVSGTGNRVGHGQNHGNSVHVHVFPQPHPGGYPQQQNEGEYTWETQQRQQQQQHSYQPGRIEESSARYEAEEGPRRIQRGY